MAPAVAPAEGQLASNLIGETVYNGTGDDAEKIGDVNELVIGKEGNVESIIIGVGGFLGIGEKNVAMDYTKIKWAEKDGDRWIVVAATKDELNALPTFDRKAYDVQPAPATATDRQPRLRPPQRRRRHLPRRISPRRRRLPPLLL